ncbi:MAG: hypothetical protein KC588_18290, partial [Nitrospira sp.]|nr:hypothetical protein [Nitrospira sp.]
MIHSISHQPILCGIDRWPILSMGLVALVLFCAPVLAQAQVTKVEELHFPPLPELVIPEPERVVLENGLVVLLMED